MANDYSNGNINAYPNDIHKALTLMNKYKPLQLDTPVAPAQRTAFVTGAEGNEKKGGTKAAATGEYLKSAAWNVLSGEEQAKVIEAKKKSKANEDDDKSTFSSKSIKSLSKMLKSLKKAIAS